MKKIRHKLFFLSFFFLLTSCFEDAGNAPTGSCNPCKVFVTAATSPANFGAVTVADQFCATDTRHPGDGTYKALITYENGSRRACTSVNCQSGGAAEGADWVLQPNTTYTRLDGTVIGKTTSAAIFSFPLAASISPTSGVAWTGFFDGGPWTSPMIWTCNNWTSTAASGPPAAGVSMINNSATYNPAFGTGANCNGNWAFICVEQ